MKAIRVKEFGGPDVLELAEVPDLIPSSGEVVVEVEAAGVNPVEVYIRSGSYAKKPHLPYTPGSDAAGRISRMGDGLEGLRVGQRVYVAGSLSGTYAEEALCAAGDVRPLPESVSSAQGAALGVPHVTACFALFHRAKARPGESLLVHGGTGGVGLAAVQFARATGMTVLATGGTPAGRELLMRQGAHFAFDHRAPDYLEAVLAATAGRGLDVILEMLANENLGRDLSILADGGRIAVIGSRGPVEINPRDAMSRNANICGVFLAGIPAETREEIHAAIFAGLENRTLSPVIAREFSLGEAAEAHRAVMAPGASGKIVLTRMGLT